MRTFDDIGLMFKSITMSKFRGEAKSTMNPEKSDQIRSTMASVRTEPERVIRDVRSVSQWLAL